MPFVIWSFEHRAWWGPARRGYTKALVEAGRYAKAEADAIVADANIAQEHEMAIPEDYAEKIERIYLAWPR